MEDSVARHQLTHVGFYFRHFPFHGAYGLLQGEEVFERRIGGLWFLNTGTIVEKIGRVDVEDLGY